MRCNPWYWLVGVIPLALVWWIALLAEQSRVEADLKTRADAYLEQSGLNWASTTFRGREASVVGRAQEESEQQRAATQVAKVWGVRSVEDRTAVLEFVKNYVWTASVRRDEVRLYGYVPSEAVRKAVIGTATASFPGRKIVDKDMKLARGAPSGNLWHGGITFALKQLGQLKSGGRVGLEGNGLVIEGEAESVSSYNALRTALVGGLPKGIVLKSDKVAPPVVRPYAWSVSWRAKRVEISGYAPSERERDSVLAAARKAFPGASVVDRMAIGAGQPRDWQKIVAVALAKLAGTLQGNADLTDQQLTVTGLTRSQETADELPRTLRSELPSRVRVTADIQQDPRAKREEEARKAAEAAERRAREEAARRAQDEQARLARVAEEDRRAREAAAERQRVARAEQDARHAAEAARSKMEKAAQPAAAQQRVAAAEDVAKREAAEARRRAAEEERQTVERAVAEARRCQTAIRSAAAEGTINFGRASAELERSSFKTLDNLAQIAKTCPDAVIEIEGHTDSEGEPNRNIRLSERRARAVVDYLAKVGISQSRLLSAGYGETRPLVRNDTEANRARNRRIVFSVRAR
jgi:outer membrane protein OmpA-like peptidoglycan-associated protein